MVIYSLFFRGRIVGCHFRGRFSAHCMGLRRGKDCLEAQRLLYQELAHEIGVVKVFFCLPLNERFFGHFLLRLSPSFLVSSLYVTLFLYA